MAEEKPKYKYRASISRYDVNDNLMASATGTIDEILKGLLSDSYSTDDYFKFDNYDISNDYVEAVHFGCLCRKRNGLKISEAVYNTGHLNYKLKKYLERGCPTDTHYLLDEIELLVRFFLFYKDAVSIPKDSEKFDEWSRLFFEEKPWQQITDIRTLKNSCGIYALILDEYSKCYIGQSQVSMMKRIQQHWRNENYITRGIDVFRALDTTRIYAIPLMPEEIDRVEFSLIKDIPDQYRLNIMQGGTLDYHEQEGIDDLINYDFIDADGFLEFIASLMKREAPYVDYFVKK